MPDDREKRRHWSDTERAQVGAMHRAGTAPGVPAAPQPEIHDEITPVAEMVADIHRAAGPTPNHDELVEAIADRVAKHSERVEKRLVNKLAYVSQGGMLDADGRVPEGHSPIAELEIRVGKNEKTLVDLVGVEGGKAGGRVDKVEKTLSTWRGLAIGAILAAVGSITGAAVSVMKLGEERGAMREWKERAAADIKELRDGFSEHLRDHRNRSTSRDRFPDAPAPVLSPDP